MKQLKNPGPQTRAAQDGGAVRQTVSEVIRAVRDRGDEAVREFSERFDRWSPESFRLSPERIEEIVGTVPAQVVEDITTVQGYVRSIAEHQLGSLREFEVETLPGVRLGQRHIPVAAAGAYVPGGRYPLVASAHMTVVTAKVAGVARVTACTPPIRGEVPAATVAAMHLAGADEILLLGGVQAVAASALGTETVGKVDMWAGPGNAYIAEAKRQLYGEVGIDLFAGPTEILVIADQAADPFVVAVDLVSQAEHGPESPAILITTSRELARETVEHIERLLARHADPRLRGARVAGPRSGLLRGRPGRGVRARRRLRRGACRGADPRPPRGARGAALLRRALPRAGHLRLLRRQGDRHQPHVAHAWSSPLHGGLWVGKYLKTVTYQEVTDPASSAYLGELCGPAGWSCSRGTPGPGTSGPRHTPACRSPGTRALHD